MTGGTVMLLVVLGVVIAGAILWALLRSSASRDAAWEAEQRRRREENDRERAAIHEESRLATLSREERRAEEAKLQADSDALQARLAKAGGLTPDLQRELHRIQAKADAIRNIKRGAGVILLLLASLGYASPVQGSDPGALSTTEELVLAQIQQIAVLEVRVAAAMAEIDRLRAALAVCGADTDREADRVRRLEASCAASDGLYEGDIERLQKRVRFSRIGCTLGVGGAGWSDDASAGVALACGFRIYP